MFNFLKEGSNLVKAAFLLGFLALIIGAGSLLMNSGQFALSVMQKMSTESIDVVRNKYSEDVNYRGSTIISEIESAQTPLENKLEITVRTLRNVAANTSNDYGYSSETDDTYTAYTETDPDDADFIAPFGSFSVNVHESNGIVTGYTFTQVQ